ncbi:MAG: energy transducer TonB [Bryobacterales bacterium]|nr:energy transducer TonB [Bryobacterales bacterium]
MLRQVSIALAVLAILGQVATAESSPSPAERFALYNLCAPIGLLFEELREGGASTGLATARLEALAEDRLRAIGLHESDAPTFLIVAASRYAVQLRYMKPVVDVASGETRTIQTFSSSAEVRDGTAAGIILEVSKLLDGFLVRYRRVNEPECGNENQPKPASRESTVNPLRSRRGATEGPTDTEPPRLKRTPRETGQEQGTGGIQWGRMWPDPESESDESRVHRTGGEVTSPRLLSKVEPSYSEKARKAGLEGVVMLSIEVWEDGRPHNIRVIRSLRDPPLVNEF